MTAIRFLKRKEIDEQKWNECIARRANSLPYAFSWYLDSVAENWEGLVSKDYEAVMPLVWLRKFGIKCLYQPYYCQQLGVFGKDLSKEKQREFLNAAIRSFPYIHINLNASAQIISKEYHFIHKRNLLLDLNKEYSQLKKKYSQNHRRNIQKAVNAQLIFSEETEWRPFQKFYLDNVNPEKENFKPKHAKIFRQLTKTLIENKSGKIFSAVNKEGKLFAASLIIRHQKRCINIINTSSASGKKNGASHFLFDNIIHKYAGTETILDFEGSSFPSIARFYEGFGAEEEIFYNYHTTIIRKLKQLFL